MADERRRWVSGAVGVFLALLSLYLLTMPGRVDMIDGQWRYEVARNWLDVGEPIVADPYLLGTDLQPVNRRTGKSYSFYNAAPSVTPIPLMALSRLLPGHNIERDRFVFSLTGPLFGALVGILLVVGYGWLGVRLRESLIYTLVFGLATLWWPASVTVFDQNQHAVLLLAALLLAWQSGRSKSLLLAALAGVLGGLLLNFQEIYAIALPAVGLAVFATAEEGSSQHAAKLGQALDRDAVRRYLVFGLCCCFGLALFLGFNEMRLGSPLVFARYGRQDELQPPVWGSPMAGFLSLAISPGKGIFWFSPPLFLACLGARRLLHRAPALALSIAGISICYLLVVVHLAFFGGDWCWGPRYVIPMMPLWALALPFAAVRLPRPNRVVVPVVVAGLLVQLLAISLDHQRFFFEANLPGNFWMSRPWFYFPHSQLAARVGELMSSIRDGVPASAVNFNARPGDQTTYWPGYPHLNDEPREWVRHFAVYYLPRPWWGWTYRVIPEKRPVDPNGLFITCGVLLAAGGALLLKSGEAGSVDLTAVQASARSAWGTGTAPPEPAVEGTGHD